MTPVTKIDFKLSMPGQNGPLEPLPRLINVTKVLDIIKRQGYPADVEEELVKLAKNCSHGALPYFLKRLPALVNTVKSNKLLGKNQENTENGDAEKV